SREESVARSECDRLMRIDRWGRLDAFAIRQELLEEWGLALTDGKTDPPADGQDSIQALTIERDRALDEVARLTELVEEREEQGGGRDASEGRANELEGAVAAEQARSGELGESLAAAQARVDELEGELKSARAQLEDRSQVDELEGAVAAEQARVGELEGAV